ncbi:hypothetical protein Ae201684P_002768 [Aphanomyces euteiches]|uniref:Integrase catalytic domain-containing protein n=1 Tax=Aphanomyces euteiches TaxID=100861 RepID=A0A6G0X2E6_9STRA|nr:hypothetical protein Ae201684_009134 [Aphanomyces euteiches]KAH9070409.1 hypothetical protein Ae201684P_002768 [Aphanomyces euteiches]
MRHPSISNRARYFITFTDDYTRYGFVYFLKHKWEALQHFQACTAFCRTQFNRQVRCLRSDNGGEYISHAFSTFLIENGIRHEKTDPHTPQQNGVSERMNRTLVECARAMLHSSHVPLQFWAEAVAHAMYLRNRSYSSSTPGTTPFERLWKSKPDLSQLRIFGCEAYFLIDESTRSKFASRTIREMYVGNEPDIKGYRLYCQKFFISRNVQFYEANSYHADSPSPLLLPTQDIFADEDSRRDECPPPPRRLTRIRRPPTRFMATTPVFQPAATSPPQSSSVPTSEQHEDVIDDSVSNAQEDVNTMTEDTSTSIPVALDDSEDMDVSTIYDAYGAPLHFTLNTNSVKFYVKNR